MQYKNYKKQYPVIILALLMATFSACSFSDKGAQRMYNKWGSKSYDMVIIPGLPLQDSFIWDRIMRGRIYWSKFLYDKGIAKNIMYSGSAVHTPYYEGTIMALYAEAIGIPKEHIFTELKAEHSTENLYYSYKKAKKLGFNSIAIASDPFQTKQLRSYAHLRLSRDIGILPFIIDTMLTIEPLMKNPVIDYQQAFKKDFIALKDRESWWKRIKGTIGWNKDKKAYE